MSDVGRRPGVDDMEDLVRGWPRTSVHLRNDNMVLSYRVTNP